jgi:UDP-3-O-[3-hydroxymyristoyl] N-acetylglucosamine deacetylase / 3-hydroxyacyl-[acyl-carrier-protein] dehydratase
MTTPKQRTVAQPLEFEGIGLHTGAAVRARILPAEETAGIRFRRVDLEDAPEIAATVGHVVDVERGTTLGVGEVRIHTVEHLLSALAGVHVDNALIELDGPEPPAGDGSSSIFAERIAETGTAEQKAPARVIELPDVLSLEEGQSSYVVSPLRAGLEVSATIRFDHPRIGRQFASFEVTPDVYSREVAPARTFGFESEVAELHARGLARGGSLDNAILLTENGLHDGVELRFSDEFARHKVLDIIGDLALLGGRLRGHVIAQRPSHRGNVALAREILARTSKTRFAAPVLNVQQILQALPHRYPLLLVDRILEFEAGKRIVGLKNVTINEPFFVGHFPGHPIMPGVLVIEAMAQVGGLLVMDSIEDRENKIVLFMSLNDVKWRKPVIPGDQIRFEVEVLQIRGRTAKMRGVGSVDGQVVAEAEMMARVVDR